ncbi:MAG: hypothetical protein NTV94_00125, partial [Planctomycetota bacterium]|nr:hypothetical protein [Planctomycetota bacterium]
AVRSRRRAIVIRHAATVAACLTVVAGAVTALMLARHTAPPHVPSAEPIAITSVGDVEAQPAPRPPTLGAFRAATRLGAEGAALATDQPLPSTPPELATPFRAHQLPDLHR